MKSYVVTHQQHDGMSGGIEVVEAPYMSAWDPAKVGLEEIGRAAAAERTCGFGFMPGAQGGSMPRVKCIALATRGVEPEEELAGIDADAPEAE